MSVNAHVQKNSLNKDGFTEYFILIVYKGSEWGIRKRYSDFVKFDEYLQQSGYIVHYKLPEKVFWSRLDPTLISKRMTELQNYLSSLLQNTLSTDNNLIREFLEVDEHILAQAIMQKKSQPEKETVYADRLGQIVKDARKSMLCIETIFRGNTNRHNVMSRTRQYSFLQGNTQTGSGATPPASPLQTGNRTSSFAGSRSASSERRIGLTSAFGNTISPVNANQSPQATPRGSFSQQGGSFSHSDKSTAHAGNRESRDSRLSSLNQAASRFLLGSYSGQTALDAALAVEDAHRKDAFLAHVARIWDATHSAGALPNEHATKVSRTREELKRVPIRQRLPMSYTPEHENEFVRSIPPTALSGINETEAEGDMFVDDINSFLLDVMSEPVLNITTARGLALHEESDIQCDAFRGLGPGLRTVLGTKWGSCCVVFDWFDLETPAATPIEGSSKSDVKKGPTLVATRLRSKSDIPKHGAAEEEEAGGGAGEAGPGLQAMRRINSDAQKLPKLKKTSSLEQ